MNQLDKYLTEGKPVDMEDFLLACLHAWYHVIPDDNQYGFRLIPKENRITYYTNRYPEFPYEALGIDRQEIYAYSDDFAKMTALIQKDLFQ